MQLDIITADKVLFTGEVESVTLPGSDGQFQVLKDHAPIISSLDKGNIIITGKECGRQEFVIYGGIVEVLANKIVVLA
ncbi:MAG: ATP synthase F1 subunit epsilon [Bacteroidota bacterium]